MLGSRGRLRRLELQHQTAVTPVGLLYVLLGCKLATESSSLCIEVDEWSKEACVYTRSGSVAVSSCLALTEVNAGLVRDLLPHVSPVPQPVESAERVPVAP